LLSRDATLLAVVRLSVRPSVTLQTAEDMVKLISRPGNPVIPVSFSPSAVTNSKRNPLAGGALNTQGWEICEIRPTPAKLTRYDFSSDTESLCQI